MCKWIFCTVLATLCLTGCAAPGGSAPPADTTTAATAEPIQTTAEPIETTAPVLTEVPTEKVWTEDVHCGLRDDGTFTEGTLFIGDSLTYGFVWEYLMRYELLGDASYMAVVGAPLSRFFGNETLGGEGAMYSSRFSGLTYSQAVEQMGADATAVYFMLGTNNSTAAEADDYIEIVDYILRMCPNATVHLQLIPCSTNPHIDYDWVNSQIRLAYDHYQAQGVEKVMLVDTFSFLDTSHLSDGVHLNSEGKDAWYLALNAHKVNNNLPE